MLININAVKNNLYFSARKVTYFDDKMTHFKCNAFTNMRMRTHTQTIIALENRAVSEFIFIN